MAAPIQKTLGADAAFKALTSASSIFLSETLRLAASSAEEFLRTTPHLGAHGVGAARAELLARSAILARYPWSCDSAPIRAVLTLTDSLANPKDRRYLGHPLPNCNPTLEAADIAIAILEAPAHVLPKFIHLYKWLEEAASSSHIYDNNWLFAPALAQIALMRLGVKTQKGLLQRRISSLQEHLVDGIYVDFERFFYYYSFWAWHYYLYYLTKNFRDAPIRLPRADITLNVLDCLLSPNGELLNLGRSTKYLEATMFPCIAIIRTHSNRRIREQAQRIYWRFWQRRLQHWCTEDWHTIFAQRANDHCSKWFYGTTYSCLWAFRGFDPYILSNMLKISGKPYSFSEKGHIVSLPEIGIFSRSEIASSYAPRQESKQFTRVHPAHEYGARVITQTRDRDFKLFLSAPTLITSQENSAFIPFRRYDGKLNGALMISMRHIWVALNSTTSESTLRLEGVSKDELTRAVAGLDLRISSEGTLTIPVGAGITMCIPLDESPCLLESLSDQRNDEPSQKFIQSLSILTSKAYFERIYSSGTDPWPHAKCRRWLGNFILADIILREATLRDARYHDLGCGNGDTVALLRDLGISIIGSDLASNAVQDAKVRWPQHAHAFEVRSPTELNDLPLGVTILLKDVDYYISDYEANALVSLAKKGNHKIIIARTAASVSTRSSMETMLRWRFKYKDHFIPTFQFQFWVREFEP